VFILVVTIYVLGMPGGTKGKTLKSLVNYLRGKNIVNQKGGKNLRGERGSCVSQKLPSLHHQLMEVFREATMKGGATNQKWEKDLARKK